MNGQETEVLEAQIDATIEEVRGSDDSKTHPCLSRAAVLNLQLGKMGLKCHAENRKAHATIDSKLDTLLTQKAEAVSEVPGRPIISLLLAIAKGSPMGLLGLAVLAAIYVLAKMHGITIP